MTSRLQATIKEYRKQLLSHERTAMASLDYAHRQTLAAIEPMLDILYKSISAKLQAGQEVPLEWLYEANRLQLIERYIEDQINAFSATAEVLTNNLQRTGAQLGTQAGMDSLQALLPAGVNFTFGLPSSQAIYSIVGATQAGSPLHDLFSGFGKEAAQGAKTALITGVTLGYNPRQIAPLVQGALDISRARALTIARTEMLRSYRDANLQTFQANNDVVDSWLWQANLGQACAACTAMNGTEHSLDEMLDSHPNCACVPVPKTKSWADILGPLGIDTSDIPETSVEMESGSDWLKRQSEDVQRRILGNAKYEAYADGKFQLSDLVGTNHDKDWGSSIYERSLKDTLEAARKELPKEPELKLLAGTIEERERYLIEHGGDAWQQSLSPDEKAAVNGYTNMDTNMYQEMNNQLRGNGYADFETMKAIHYCQDALLKSSAPIDMIVHRGYGDEQSLLEKFQEAAKTGGYFQEKGFASTTIKPGGDIAYEEGFVVNIHVFKGAPGAYIAPLSDSPAEREWLIPHGAMFQVVGAKQVNGKWVFEIEYRGLD